MPEEFVRYGETFARLHVGWEMKLWSEENLPPLRNQALFDQAATYAQKADILRYEILLEYGGVYLDTDFECLKPLDELLGSVRAFSATEDTQWISIGIMGAVPGHPLLRAVVDELPRAILARPDAPVNEQTGPLFFTRIVTARRLKGLDQDFVVYPPELFYPYGIGEKHLKNGPFPRAYAVHHWAASWLAATSSRSKLTSLPKEETRMATPSDEPERILLGLDPEQPQAALSILISFQRLFGPRDKVELGIYAYAEPSLPLLECIQLLMRSLVGDPAQMASVSLLSRAELSEVSYIAAYFPSGDEIKDASNTASVIFAMHRIKADIGTALVDRPSTPSRQEVMTWAAHRPKQATGSAPTRAEPRSNDNAPVLHGTGLGNGRVLVKTRAGYPILCAADDLSLTPELLLHGEYDRPLLSFIETRLAPGQVAFDIGANIGLFSVAMARAVGPSGHVVAYEAMPENYRYLIDNVSMNYQSEHCTLLRKAAFSKQANFSFAAPRKFLGNGFLCAKRDEYLARYPGDELDEIEVEAVPAEEQLRRFDSVALVKVDVEGAEYQVLRGMDQSIRSGRIAAVTFECLASLLGDDFPKLVAYLASLAHDCGLGCWTLDAEGRPTPLPLSTLEQLGKFTQVLLSREG